VGEEGVKFSGIEETFFHLLEAGGAKDMEQGNLLIMLSLVNLMGIINIINYRIGLGKGVPAGGPREGTGAGEGPGEATRHSAPPLDPASLLAMLGGKGGSGLNPAQLGEILSRLLPPPGGQRQGPAPEEAGGGQTPPGGGSTGG